MRPSELLSKHRQQILSLSAQFNFANPRIFGSVLNGSDTESSDLDLLVEPMPKTTMFDLCGLKDELETLLGIKVDILTPRSLPAKFREQVIQKARPV
ncbi:MAG: nucleotidyltransferase family protein [Pasteurellaceae bacterium]|nr:nucleotidyltransferase family protein [Pasteurellaceae bacterium]